MIVRVKPGAAARAQGLFRALGHKVRRFNPPINAFALDAADAERLAEYLDVESISLDADILANQAVPAPGTLASGPALRRHARSDGPVHRRRDRGCR